MKIPKIIQIQTNRGEIYALDENGYIWIKRYEWEHFEGPEKEIVKALTSGTYPNPHPTGREEDERGESVVLGDTPWEQL